MRLHSWFANRSVTAKPLANRRHKRRSFGPRLELLEDRTVPSVPPVTNTDDSGSGSLRAAIDAANDKVNNPGLDVISFNISGTGVHTIRLLSPLPVVTDPLDIEGYSQPGTNTNSDPNGFNANLGIEIDGGSLGASFSAGLWFKVGGNTIRGLIINRFSAGAGIFLNATGLGGNNFVEGNILGTDAAGTLALGNGAQIMVNDSNNVIGGATPDARNVIAGNSTLSGTNYGIILGSGNQGPEFGNNKIIGNFIGTNPAGTGPVGQGIGISIAGFASETQIGGTLASERNVISGNAGVGILINNDFHQVVQGNYIGTDVTGTTAVPNAPTHAGNGGISIGGKTNSLIGGTAPGAGNLISGNGVFGIAFIPGSATQGVTIQGNRIGVSASGGGLRNQSDGISLLGTDTLVGGTLAGAGNVIAYNGGSGITFTGSDSGARIQGNEIRNNVADGIRVFSPAGAPPKLIGGRNPGEGNVITANGLTGVNVTSGTRIEVAGNSIFANGRLGISLTGGTPSPLANDTDDVDAGANTFQNYPVLTLAQSGATTHVAGSLNSIGDALYRLDFYASAVADPSGFREGQRYLGFLDVFLSGNTTSFAATVGTSIPGEVVTATATDVSGNTSEFSGVITVTNNVNVAPSFDAITDQTVTEDLPQPVAINHVSAGPPVESGQDVTFTVTWDNHQLIENITITPASGVGVPTRMLTYVLKPNAHGMATVTVTAKDDGGTANGGDDDTTDDFIITVNADNDAPKATDGAFRTASGPFFGSPITIDLRTLVSDVETSNNDLIYEIVTQPNDAVFQLNTSAHDHTIVPVGGFVGVITFTYRVTDLGDGASPPRVSDVRTVTINVTADRPDLRIVVTPVPDPAVTGEALRYVIHVENLGLTDANNVRFSFVQPAAVVRNGRRTEFQAQSTFVDVTPDLPHGTTYQQLPVIGGSVALVLQLGLPLRPVTTGDSATIEVIVRPLVANKSITAYVAASSDQADANPADNAAVATTFVNAPQADVCVRVVTMPDPARVGSELVYRIEVTNNGPQTAHHVRVLSFLPYTGPSDKRIGYLDPVIIEPPTVGTAGTLANQTVPWGLDSLASGASASLTIHGMVKAKAANLKLTNRVTVAADELDANTGNNAVRVVTQVAPAPDLSVSLKASADQIKVNGTLIYTVTVKNNGPGASSGVQLRLQLPAGVTFVSISPSQGATGPANDSVLVNLSQLADGAATTIVVKVIPRAMAQLLATASVGGSQPDSDLNNNSVSLVTTAGPQIELIQNGTFEPLQQGAPNPWVLSPGASIVQGHLELRPDRRKQQSAEQAVAIPTLVNRLKLTFTLNLAGRDKRNQLVVDMLVGNVPIPLFVLDGDSANGQYIFDNVPAFPGLTVRLRFHAITSGEKDINFTNFKIDDVSLCAT